MVELKFLDKMVRNLLAVFEKFQVITARDIVLNALTYTTLWANSADDKLMIFSLFFQKIGIDISCKLGDNLHEMSKSIF